MCGIAGAIGTKAYAIADKQRHRGPDNFSVNETFAHNRLSIIDLSEQGNQPMTCGDYELTFNGEIYNYKELFSYLSPHDDMGDYTIPGDARVFLKYINRFGLDKALRDANGMWAFGLKKDNIITLCVDRLGQKPLYYYHDNEIFAFASCPSALLHLKEKWQISEQGLASYWKLGATMVHSIWDGIFRVYASERVTYNIATRTITTERYWQPEYKPNEDLRELVIDSIKKVKVADVPVYVFLSGGIDSSVVTSQGFANAVHMDGPERKYAEQVAQRFGTKLHIVSPGQFDAVECMTDYVTKCGEPSMSALIPYIVSRETAKLCKVAVSANGADELFFGYDRTQQKVTQEQLSHIFRLSGTTDLIKETDIDDQLSIGRWLELQTYVQHDLNKTLDFASMAWGLEVRAPFLDHRLVEAALSKPQADIGRKALLKQMLREQGFDDRFLNRPKMGFTLYQKPVNYDVDKAYKWCVLNGWLKDGKYSPRDLQYLKASAFSFRIWWETYKNKIA
jgi:asparagine synthase (glutamine-hydrolysing)